MEKKYIPPIIMLLAGLITSIFNIYYKVSLLNSLKRLLLTLIIFYVIGKLSFFLICKITKPSTSSQDSEDSTTDNED